jgi:hypothetical protein
MDYMLMKVIEVDYRKINTCTLIVQMNSKLVTLKVMIFLLFHLILSLCCNMYIHYINIIHTKGSYSNILY